MSGFHMLPRLPSQGTPMRKGELRRVLSDLIDYLRMITPVSSPTVRARLSPGGTAFDASPAPARSAAAAATALPFVNLFTQTSATGGTWVPGKTYFAGTLLTVTNEPATISVDASHYRFWIEVYFETSSAEWKSGAAFPTPPMGDALEYYRMLDVTLDGDDEIVSFVCPTPHDIHVIAKSN